jgi:8-oxo-dGTP pyrophosphatase MutT (NUDIX family)
MTPNTFDPQWLKNLQAGICLPPLRPRLALTLNGQPIGSVESEVMQGLVTQGLDLSHTAFSLTLSADEASWHITGDGTQAFAHMAQALHAADVARVRQQWRDEQLGVFNEAGELAATAERGIMRLLGLATRAVHLHAYATDGRAWVQQRAWNKTTDPGLWDTLMGGMIPATDTLQDALKRETWEEAGIHIERVQHLRLAGHFVVQRPNAVDGGLGYVVERIDWFEGQLPDGLVPQNQDGEVLQFALLDQAAMVEKLKNGAFTTEAAMILLQATGA